MTTTRRRRGYTFVEMLTVMMLIGALAGLAIPHLTYMKRRAIVAQAIAESHTVRLAALTYHSEHGEWPAEAGAGVVPPELVSYLPSGYTFDKGQYQLDWEMWALPDGMPQQPQNGVLVGVSMFTDDTELGRIFLDALGPAAAKFTSGNHYTYIVLGG